MWFCSEELRSADLLKALGAGEQVQGREVSAQAKAAPVHNTERGQGSLFLGASIALTPLAFHPTNIVPIFFFFLQQNPVFSVLPLD